MNNILNIIYIYNTFDIILYKFYVLQIYYLNNEKYLNVIYENECLIFIIFFW